MPRRTTLPTRSRRLLGLVTAAASVATAAAVGLPSSASAATLDTPGPLIAGGFAELSGTCEVGTEAAISFSWDGSPWYAEVEDDGRWEYFGYLATEPGPATITVDCVEPGGGDAEVISTTALDVVLLPPTIDVEVTVGTDPDTCGTEDEITVTHGVPVFWCATLTNNSGDMLQYHEIEAALGGLIVTDHLEEVDPGDSVNTVDLGLELTSDADGPLAQEIIWRTYILDGERYRELEGRDTARVLVEDDAPGTTTTAPGTPAATPAPPARPQVASPAYTG